MAMARSSLARVSRRLSGSVMRPSGQEIPIAPPLPSRRLQGLQHFLVIGRGTEGMKQANQIRYLLTERKGGDSVLKELARSAVKRTRACFNEPSNPRVELMLVSTGIAATFAWMAKLHFFPVSAHDLDAEEKKRISDQYGW